MVRAVDAFRAVDGSELVAIDAFHSVISHGLESFSRLGLCISFSSIEQCNANLKGLFAMSLISNCRSLKLVTTPLKIRSRVTYPHRATLMTLFNDCSKYRVFDSKRYGQSRHKRSQRSLCSMRIQSIIIVFEHTIGIKPLHDARVSTH